MLDQNKTFAGTAPARDSSGIPFPDTDLVAVARSLAPVLRARADEIGRLRRIPADVIDMLKNAGLFQLLRPRSAGGREVRMDVALDVAYELARGDGSVAWVWTVMTTHDFLVAHFPRKAREEYWSGLTLSAASFMPAGRVAPAANGVRLSGKWSFCSGADNADWLLLSANFTPQTAKGAPPDIRMLMVPSSACRVIDDWHVMGLKGTGSNTVTVDDVFVPDYRILKFDDLAAGRTPGSPDHASPVYRAPLWSVFPFSIASMGPGIARGAFEAFVEEKRAGKVAASLPPAKKYSMQMRVSEAGALIDAAELLFRRSLRETIDKVMAEEPLSLELRARNRRDQSYAVSMSKKAVELLFQAEGSKGLFEGAAVQRAFCDLHAASVHLAVGWEAVAINYGEIVLGGEPVDHMF